MAIKKVETLQEYAALKHSAGESDVTLVADENRLMYDGVNVQVTVPKPGDAIYRDASGELHYIARDTLATDLMPAGWQFVEYYYYGWSEDPFVDMGLPSGLKWAKKNIDVTQPDGFAKSPYQYDCSFCSWGNVDMHNPNGTSFSGSYNWGGVNAEAPYYEGQVYGSTPGAELTASFTADSGHDAARENLGAPWRMPTTTEFAELFNNSKYIDADGNDVPATKADKRVSMNGITGLYLQSKVNGRRLFFACSGNGNGQSWSSRGSYGLYWSASFGSARYARGVGFYASSVYPQYNGNRYYGFAVRPVQ